MIKNDKEKSCSFVEFSLAVSKRLCYIISGCEEDIVLQGESHGPHGFAKLQLERDER